MSQFEVSASQTRGVTTRAEHVTHQNIPNPHGLTFLFQLIFANIKHLNAKGDSVERITLEQFRDEVVLCTGIEGVIKEAVDQQMEIPRSVVQMLLVLGNCFV